MRRMSWVVVLVLATCADPGQQLVGQWDAVDRPQSIIFNADHTALMMRLGTPSFLGGTWEATWDELTLEWDGFLPVAYAYRFIEAGELEIGQTRYVRVG